MKLAFFNGLFFIVAISFFQISYTHQQASMEIANAINSDDIEVATEIAKNMKEIVDILPINSVTQIASQLLLCSNGIGMAFTFGKDILFPKEDPVMQKLESMTNLIINKLNEISEQIQDLKGFISDQIFQDKVTFLVNQLMGHIELYFKGRTSTLKHKLNITCQTIGVESIFLNMQTLLDGGVILNQLESKHYSDEAFFQIELLYKNMMKQLLIAFPICENLMFGEVHGADNLTKRYEHIENFVKEIEEKLENINEIRKPLMVTTLSPNRNWYAFENIVNEAKNGWNFGWEIGSTIYGTSKCGQRYAIVVTKVVRHALYLFMDEPQNEICETYRSFTNEPWIKYKVIFWRSNVEEVVRRWRRWLEDGDYEEFND